MAGSVFTYTPLPHGHVRLLTLSGVKAGGQLDCRLETEEISNSLDFYALSYAWGSNLRCETISCNDQMLPITQSVQEALTALRPVLAAEGMPIWVDAICINQEDDAEKEREVLRMDVIYRQAKSVLVWLGLESQDSDVAMSQIAALAENIAKIEQHPGLDDLPRYGLPHKNDPVWLAIGHLYQRKWFGRLWTFQEAVLATSLRVVCGDKTADWKHFSQLGADLNRTGLFRHVTSDKNLSDSEDGFQAVSTVSWAKYAKERMGQELAILAGKEPESENWNIFAKKREHIPFASLLMVSQTKLCADPRDRVYGMLSLTAAEFRANITVSYSQELSTLYIEVGKACLQQDKTLTYLQMQAGRPKMPGLPSWCINLDSFSRDILPFEVYLRAGIRDNDPDLLGATVQVFPSRNDIELFGFRVDRIDSVIPPYAEPRGRPAERAPRRSNWLAQCLQLAHITLGDDLTEDEIHLSHVYAVTANTIARVPDGAALRQACKDIDKNVSSQTPGIPGDAPYLPPEDRIPLFNDTQTQLFRACSGRAYFTTTGGRLGIGPPEMKTGDILVIIYGCRPVFTLREVPGSDMFQFVGDAFVHGLMELSKTPVEVIRQDETFNIE